MVEDEEGLRSLNARGLRSRGYSVVEASNGIEALEVLEEKNGAVDLVVSDVVMPEMDGPTLLKSMRAETKPRTDLTGQGTILLVEDEEGLRSLNARGLRSRGYSVVEASNGIEALEMLEEKNGAVDLVVSDVVMPEMDGPTLLKSMREKNPDLKIIFVSGYAEDAFEKSLPENQQFAFLPKPFTLSQLVAAVKETMTPS